MSENKFLDNLKMAAYKIAKQPDSLGRISQYVTISHVFRAWLDLPEAQQILEDLEVDVAATIQFSESYITNSLPRVPANRSPSDTPDVAELYKAMEQVPFNFGRVDGIATDLLIVMMLYINPNSLVEAQYLTRKQGLTQLKVKQYIAQSVSENAEAGGTGGPAESNGEMNDKKAEKILAKYCTNLNEVAQKGEIDPLVGREDTVFRLAKILSRRKKNNPILVGEPGVGKTQIVEGLAKLIVEQAVPEPLLNTVVYSLDIGNLMAGSKFRGDLEDRLKAIFKALEHISTTSKVNPMIFIDEIHMIMGAGAAGESKTLDVANLLKPHLAKGKLRCTGSTTPDEYRKHFEKDKALIRRFLRLDIDEPSIEDAIKIMSGLRKYYEAFHGITYTDAALESAVRLSARYITNRQLPDKAIDVIDSAGAQQRVISITSRKTVVDVLEIEREIAEISKVPLEAVENADAKKPIVDIGPQLKLNIFGQDEAIETLSGAVHLARAGLNDPERPRLVVLFTGPTGTGKTEVTRELARHLGIPMTRFDMSEFMEKHAVSRLVGAPPGYVGYDDGDGKLIEAIDLHPNQVLLFDEFEKAHPDVQNILLQLMDAGRLTSAKGKTVYGKELYLVITTNAGSADAAKGTIGFNAVAFDSTRQEEAINKHFSPEFRNRLDAIVYFNELAPSTVKLVADKFINQLKVMLIDKNITISLTDAARDYIAKNGYDAKYGARPMKRLITDKIKKPLSREILFGALKNGGNVVLDCIADSLTFTYNPIAHKEIETVNG